MRVIEGCVEKEGRKKDECLPRYLPLCVGYFFLSHFHYTYVHDYEVSIILQQEEEETLHTPYSCVFLLVPSGSIVGEEG